MSANSPQVKASKAGLYLLPSEIMSNLPNLRYFFDFLLFISGTSRLFSAFGQFNNHKNSPWLSNQSDGFKQSVDNFLRGN
jgi:hypothetical protein